MRFESLQDDIRWDLKDDIWDEEDGQCGIVLVPRQSQILLQPENGCIGDVGPVEECEKIENAQHWNDTKIDPGDEPALTGVGRTLHAQVIVVFGVGTGNVRVIVIACTMMLLVVEASVRTLPFVAFGAR